MLISKQIPDPILATKAFIRTIKTLSENLMHPNMLAKRGKRLRL